MLTNGALLQSVNLKLAEMFSTLFQLMAKYLKADVKIKKQTQMGQ